ncbi:putative nudix hydrolase 7 [Smittium culicis]|uniref:Putative nudix hydrolase 7 n=1 Tax=Smittium culicis TaxID=133412 RepID=A0A1R1X013_9FUNG|nr:putative nudix hydrolase 7 [Smittium culicis]OMJ18060.1 putative nudix hydrolase 7 [Smittium culicis]
MAKRVPRGSFPGVHVFPGGKVDFSDGLDEWKDHIDQTSNQKNSFNLNSLEPTDICIKDFKVCAIREMFEETGFLLTSPPFDDHFCNSRNAEFSDLVKSNNLSLLTSRLLYFSRFITPESYPRRWDVQFFMANISESEEDSYLLSQIYPHLNPKNEQCMSPQNDEMEFLDWRTPDKLLDAFCDSSIFIVTPQIYLLSLLKLFNNWKDLQDFAIYKDSVDGVVPLSDYVGLKTPATLICTLPGDHLYSTPLKDDIDINGHGDTDKPLHRVIITNKNGENKSIQLVENVLNIPGIKSPSLSTSYKL